MGWFFNRNNDNNHQNNQQRIDSPNKSGFQQKNYSSYYSKKRRCQNDPQDNNYIICKTVIKDKNGTRQQEQRVPVNSWNGSTENYQSSSIFSSIGWPFGTPIWKNQSNQQQESEQQKVFSKFPSFFIQPSFFDFHNTSPNYHLPKSDSQQYNEVQSYTYSSSRSCQPDPQDQQYFICKSKIYDGQQTKQIQQRVKISQQNQLHMIGKQFMSMGGELNREIQQLKRQFGMGWNMMQPFIFPMMRFMDDLNNPQNLKKRWKQNYVRTDDQFGENRRNYGFQRNGKQKSKNYFKENKRKDTKVYDL